MYRRTALSIESRKILRLLMYTLLIMMIAASSYFFIKMSATAEKGYSVRENQLQQKNLEAENRVLEQRVLDAQSLSQLKKNELLKEFVEPNSTIYVAPRGPLSKRK